MTLSADRLTTTGAPPAAPSGADVPAVCSYTEWDPLEEVIVGGLSGAVLPSWQDSMEPVVPAASRRLFQETGGHPFPPWLVEAAEAELDGLAEVLRDEGVRVVRPDAVAHGRPFAAPGWSSPGGLYAGMPRDVLLVAGDVMVEAPMSWRCRQHEVEAFRPLLKDYFRRGARWLPGPRPLLTEQLWDGGGQWAVGEFEPVFDAADFVRFGDDILAQRSHVTNAFGINWLARALGPEFRVTTIPVDDPGAMHIDATIVPLAPRRLLVNPDRFVGHELFDGWDIRAAPPPALPRDWPMYLCSPWVSMNVLSLDPETVVVESHEEPLIEMLTDWGFRCVPVDFRHVYSFGGSFHCVTLDVRRSGSSGRYLNSRRA
ncbi:hypothetical protein [Spirillospora sp. CA-294931]|uniref:hypothetical protein n=1 Tax=Spirillospora sp. CA-294931 TaxID=3240042 RepID=UPI003D907CCA